MPPSVLLSPMRPCRYCSSCPILLIGRGGFRGRRSRSSNKSNSSPSSASASSNAVRRPLRAERSLAAAEDDAAVAANAATAVPTTQRVQVLGRKDMVCAACGRGQASRALLALQAQWTVIPAIRTEQAKSSQARCARSLFLLWNVLDIRRVLEEINCIPTLSTILVAASKAAEKQQTSWLP